MNKDNLNVIIATLLSLAVFIAWDYFYARPLVEKDRQAQSSMQTQQPATGQRPPPAPGDAGQAPGTTTPQPAEAPPQTTRVEALAESPRVKIDAPAIFGSINLKGARLDDVSFKNYRETVDPKSPHIVLFSPADAPEPYYAELGFLPGPGETAVLPGPDTLWQADHDTLTPSSPVTLSWDNGHGLIFHRKIAVDDHYMFTVTDSVENKSGQPVTLHRFGLVKRQGKPPTAGYSILHEGFVGVIGGESGVQQVRYDKIEKEDHGEKRFEGMSGWLGLTDKYWAAAVIPTQEMPIFANFLGIGSGPGMTYQSGFVAKDALSVAPGATGESTSRVFAGAKETSTLDNYETTLKIDKFDRLIDWGWFYFITKPMFRLIHFIYSIVGNFGVAILCVTVLVKAVFFPLANRAYVSMAKMKAIQPQIAALKDRFPEDKQKQQMEVMALYRREKINPLSGCLPVLIQLPVFFALYKVLVITIEMRQAPFFGWIKDLSRPDPTNVFNLFGLIPFDPTHVPTLGPYLVIGAWPLIMGITMFIQMKMNPQPADPIQAQVLTWMPVVFTFTLSNFASGLVIYWAWNNSLSVIQQGAIMKKAGAKIELWDNLVGMFRKKKATKAAT